MSNRAFPIQQTSDRNIQFAQGGLQQALGPLLKNPITNGYLIDDVVLASGDNTISHGLGRVLLGYLIVLKSANVDIYDKQATNTTPQKTLILNSASAVTVTLYVF